MRFQSLEEFEKLGLLLAEADFEQADCRWETNGASFVLETARPASEALKGAGLFRKPRPNWIKCRLVIRQVRKLSLWEEYDAKPPFHTLLKAEPAEGGFKIRLASAHGLRVDLTVDRLDGVLEEAESSAETDRRI